MRTIEATYDLRDTVVPCGMVQLEFNGGPLDGVWLWAHECLTGQTLRIPRKDKRGALIYEVDASGMTAEFAGYREAL